MICGLVDSWLLSPQVVNLENDAERLLTPFFAGFC
jgi:hypothetical protein